MIIKWSFLQFQVSFSSTLFGIFGFIFGSNLNVKETETGMTTFFSLSPMSLDSVRSHFDKTIGERDRERERERESRLDSPHNLRVLSTLCSRQYWRRSNWLIRVGLSNHIQLNDKGVEIFLPLHCMLTSSSYEWLEIRDKKQDFELQKGKLFRPC